MRYRAGFVPLAVVALVALVSASCGAPASDGPPPPISSASAEALVPVQLARAAALKTEISSAGETCDQVTRTFLQGTYDGFQMWNAECADGHTYGILGDAHDGVRVLSCDAAERITGTKCFEEF
jgi:hypothetical protein